MNLRQAAKFQIVPTHDETMGEELYYIVCSSTSGKADEMVREERASE